MDYCLLCLELNKEFVDHIKVDSSQWQEHKIEKLIEKHLWNMEPLLPSSWLCLNCWQSLYDFHKFYMHVESAHMRIKNNPDEIEKIIVKDDLNEFDLESEIVTEHLKAKDSDKYIKQELDEERSNENLSLIRRSKRNRHSKDVTANFQEDPLKKSLAKSKDRKIKSWEESNSNFKSNFENIQIEELAMIEENLQKHDESEKLFDSSNGLDSSSDYDDETQRITKRPKRTAMIEDDALHTTHESGSSDSNDIDSSSDYDDTSDTNTKRPKKTRKKKTSRKICDDYKPDFDDETVNECSETPKKTPKQVEIFLSEHFKMSCDLCRIPMENWGTLVNHFEMQHTAERCYAVCCNRKFYRRNELRDHVHVRHVDPNVYKCKLCGKVLSGHKNLKYHQLSTHVSDKDKKFECSKCDKRFASQTFLNQHINIVHLKKYSKTCKQTPSKKSKLSMPLSEIKNKKKESPKQSNTTIKSEFANSKFETISKNNKLSDLSDSNDLDPSSEYDHKSESGVNKPKDDDTIVMEKDTLQSAHESGSSDSNDMNSSLDCDDKSNIKTKEPEQTRKKKTSRTICDVYRPDYDDETKNECSETLKKTPEQVEQFLSEHFKMTCVLCQITMDNWGSLVEHFELAHNERCYAVCCNRKFYRRTELREHVHVRHVDPNVYKCKQCGKLLSGQKNLKYHLLTHVSDEDKKFACSKCDKRFASQTFLNQHINWVHLKKYAKKSKLSKSSSVIKNKKQKSLKQSNTTSEFETISKNKQNSDPLQTIDESSKLSDISDSNDLDSSSEYDYNSENAGNEPKEDDTKPCTKAPDQVDAFLAEHYKMTCDLCQMSIANWGTLFKHFEIEHKEPCYAVCCNKKFYRRCELREHVHVHVDPDINKCDQCGKVLKSHKSLKYHILRHMSEEDKKFECTKCGKRFVTQNFLASHNYKVHLKKYIRICEICGKSLYSDTLERHMLEHEGKSLKVNCEICGLVVAHKNNLKLHMKNQHPIGGKQTKTCPICNKISASTIALNQHMYYVHSDKTRECTICGKSFKAPRDLREHMTTHNDVALYTCSWCPKTFKSNSSYFHHRKKYHPTEVEEERKKKYLEKYIVPTLAEVNKCS